ncbi:DUF4349 domain-containing protein [Pseudomonas chlororaphis]|uniref:DUF4349 domain-containing protein n=1 Tax=Pseudomonas chlororaphis TaxID=587753 RepID=A0A0D5Y2U8_9PSED|nr:DUF4349 domain-containing protein [Pseudomonas chlororaphis]AKA25304.1 hypothetical protein PCL1606_38530 [Pseudomonas chlororaphis]
MHRQDRTTYCTGSHYTGIHRPGTLACLLLSSLLAACSPSERSSSVAIGGAQGKAGAQLAYEHELTLSLPSAQIADRLNATREACESAKFGACNILRLEQGERRAQAILRIVPDGVEPIVGLAAQGAEIGQRITSAEDLADAVADVQRQQERLKAQQQRLDQLAARKDITVSDLIVLSKEQASIENDLQALAQAAAGQQRRIDTNRLTLNFVPTDSSQRGSKLQRAFDNLLDNLAYGTAEALEKGSYVLPFLILTFPLVMIWVWLWRRFVRRR